MSVSVCVCLREYEYDAGSNVRHEFQVLQKHREQTNKVYLLRDVTDFFEGQERSKDEAGVVGYLGGRVLVWRIE